MTGRSIGSDAPASEGSGPLSGLTVLDCSTFVAGAVCARVLADFGANWIKVEVPAGDPVREMGAQVNGLGLLWKIFGRNAKPITLDLHAPEGQDIFRELTSRADVVVENFRPGVMERWGLGPEQLHAVNPQLVVARITGFGQSGPYARRPAVGRIGQAFSGLSFMTGERGGRPLVPASAALSDHIGGWTACLGVLMALMHARESGVGQVVDCSLYEASLPVLEDAFAVLGLTGEVRTRAGSESPSHVPHDHYETSDGRWIAIACSSTRLFRRLCDVMASPGLRDDPELQSNAGRRSRRSDLDRAVAEWVHTRDFATVSQALSAGEVPFSLIFGPEDMLQDPHYIERQSILSIEDDELGGSLLMPGVTPRLSLTPGAVAHPGLGVGACNDEVYGGLLGLLQEELESLRERCVI